MAKQIILENPIILSELNKKYDLKEYQFVNVQIGYDNAVYFLFSGHVPERISGMFVDTQANADYKVICLHVDWTDGTIVREELFHLGVHEMNFHFVQPIGENILLLGARCHMYSDGVAQKNAVIVDKAGQVLGTYCFGDGIQDCFVTSKSQIITSYFDEGVFGNFGWGYPYAPPIGECGLIKWDTQGTILWKNEKYNIYDCYAMNLDDRENLWFYYYDEFDLVKTDFNQDVVYHMNIAGSGAFVITEDGRYVLVDGGYNRHMMYKAAEILGNKLGVLFDVEIKCGENIKQAVLYAVRGSKAVFHEEGNFYLKSISGF